MHKYIVWIEDDIDALGAVIWPLESAGYKFTRICNTTEALDSRNLERIREADLILLDLMIPSAKGDIDPRRLPGTELPRALRNVYNIQVPVIVFSVIVDDRILEELTTLGITDFIHKPVRPSELKERVEKALHS